MKVLHFNRCNNHCKHCMVINSFKELPLTKESAKQIIDQALPSELIDFFGGEPTVFPFVYELMEYASKKEHSFTLATNGRIFSIKSHAKRLASLHPHKTRISFYSLDEMLFDDFTQVPGSFKQTVRGIQNLIAVGIVPLIHIIISNINVTKLSEIVTYLHSLGIKVIGFSSLYPYGNVLNNKDLFIPFREIKQPLNDALTLGKQYGIRMLIERMPFCIAPQHMDVFQLDLGTDDINITKGDFCTTCKLHSSCAGFSKKYFELFGDADFREFKKLLD